MRFLFIICVALLFNSCRSHPGEHAARELTSRVVPQLSDRIDYHIDESRDSVDWFTLSENKDKVLIEGNSAGSLAMGLNYYLKNYCLTTVSWYIDDPVQLPDSIGKIVSPVTVKALVPDRFFLNYCTSGYSMPWWSWRDWERFIDWMAMNGINMPLATTGQEAIWYNVWRHLGMTDEDIRAYFTGPAHLPWHRMCNLDRWQGPLPLEWLEDQAELQKRIVERERQLSMRPVLPGFAGHIPDEIARIFPNSKTTTVSQWGGFPDEYRCTYLSPTDTLFKTIQRLYLNEQTKLYGTDHIYGIDPFNEVDPPTWDPDTLSIISRDIYNSVAAVDPDAKWLQMAWLLYADPSHWSPERARAYITGVPQGKMILLDYYCESVEEWKLFDSFYGQPYIWCYLGNFGGNSFLAAPIKDVANRITDVLENGGDNLVGIGSTLEGLDMNPYMYEYILGRAWDGDSDTRECVQQIADRRLGYRDETVRQAWRLLADSILLDPALCGQGPLTNARPSLTGFSWWTTKPNVSYPNSLLLKVWGMLLDVDTTNVTYAHTFDCVNIGRQVLSNYFMTLRDEFTDAYNRNDLAELKSKGSDMVELLDDLSDLLNSNHGTRMSKWISDARSKGSTPPLKDFYERNARTLVTIWGPSRDLNDYANRQWAELNRCYYTPRWKMFVEDVITAAERGNEFSADEFFTKSREFENNWIEPRPLEYEIDAPLDNLEVAIQLYLKYREPILARSSSGIATSCPSLHHW